jgi:HPt (histidine-containing phosphotransfer) domain-containing protein
MTGEIAPILDLGVIDDLRVATGDDEEFLADLIGTYVEEGDDLLEAMSAALVAGDAADLVRPAHTLKSSSASVGAMRLAELCRSIEASARTGELDQAVANDVAQVPALWAATLEALAAAGLSQ